MNTAQTRLNLFQGDDDRLNSGATITVLRHGRMPSTYEGIGKSKLRALRDRFSVRRRRSPADAGGFREPIQREVAGGAQALEVDGNGVVEG